ncbi:MAG: hypothetical protein WBD13_11830 [Burkholderiaceae bacterium]
MHTLFWVFMNPALPWDTKSADSDNVVHADEREQGSIQTHGRMEAGFLANWGMRVAPGLIALCASPFVRHPSCVAIRQSNHSGDSMYQFADEVSTREALREVVGEAAAGNCKSVDRSRSSLPRVYCGLPVSVSGIVQY